MHAMEATYVTKYLHTEVSLLRENRKVVFTKIAVLSKCPKERHSPPRTLHFNMFSGGDCLSLGHLLRTWRTEKIPYAKLTSSETSVCKYSALVCVYSGVKWYKIMYRRSPNLK